MTEQKIVGYYVEYPSGNYELYADWDWQPEDVQKFVDLGCFISALAISEYPLAKPLAFPHPKV